MLDVVDGYELAFHVKPFVSQHGHGAAIAKPELATHDRLLIGGK